MAWSRDPAPPACSPARGFGSDGAIRRPKPKEDSVKLTDTQLVLLSRASQRGDGALEIPDTLKGGAAKKVVDRSEEHTSELQSQSNLVCRLLLEKKKKVAYKHIHTVT